MGRYRITRKSALRISRVYRSVHWSRRKATGRCRRTAPRPTRVRVPRRRAAARDCKTPAAGCPRQRGFKTVSCPLWITSTPSRCQLVPTWQRVCVVQRPHGAAARSAQHTLWGALSSPSLSTPQPAIPVDMQYRGERHVRPDANRCHQ